MRGSRTALLWMGSLAVVCDDGEEILFPYFTNGCFKPPFPREPQCSDGSVPYVCYAR